jgi:hypothetical protein
MKRLLAGIACAFALAGCSSSWLPNLDLSPVVVNRAVLDVDSQPPGAEARTSTGSSCRTPCSLPVTVRGDFSVTFTLDRFTPQTVTVRAIEPVGRYDPDSRPVVQLDPNPVMVELQPAPPPPRARRQPARRRAATPAPRRAQPPAPPPQ